MKIYLAGKIGAHDWRHSIVRGLSGAFDGTDVIGGGEIVSLPTTWPVLPNSILGQHDYVGPFFMPTYLDWNHGYYPIHGDSMHGNALADVSAGVITIGAVAPSIFNFVSRNHGAASDHEDTANRHYLARLCLRAVSQSDAVFVWMDSMTAYGTLVEIGFAVAYNKQIWWAQPDRPYDQPSQDLWFGRALATINRTDNDPLSALQYCIAESESVPRYTNGYVYLLQSGEYVKIGKSKDVDQRITQIKPKTPLPVKLLHVIASNDMSWAEALLHRRYAQHRTNGEWFHLPQSELPWLMQIKHLTKPTGSV